MGSWGARAGDEVATPGCLTARGDAFADGRRDASRTNPSTNPRVRYHTYADDPRFVQALGRVQATGVPWVLFHLAFYPEIKAGREYILDSQQRALLDSLERMSGKVPLQTIDHVQMPMAEPERMNTGPDNFHPSLWGMELYARAVTEALVRSGLVRERRRP